MHSFNVHVHAYAAHPADADIHDVLSAINSINEIQEKHKILGGENESLGGVPSLLPRNTACYELV